MGSLPESRPVSGGARALARWICRGGCLAMTLLLASPAAAETSPPAVVWYRSSEGCADGPRFLAQLGERRALARLAEAGDHIDFVVTVATTAEGATGRVERQTQSGTVAMREVDDASCDRVVQVLALHLALALDPDQDPPETSETPASPTAGGQAAPESLPASEPAPEAESPPQPPPAPAPPAAEPSPLLAEQAAEPPHDAEPWRWRVGAQGGVVTGIAPAALPRATTFVQLDASRRSALPDLSMRLAASGTMGSSETSSGDVEHWVLAGRFDLCPVGFGTPSVTVAPCAAVELGANGVSRSSQDTSLWAALAAHGRVTWRVSEAVALEGELGAVFPLTRYEIHGQSDLLYRTAAAGLSAGLGASIGFP